MAHPLDHFSASFFVVAERLGIRVPVGEKSWVRQKALLEGFGKTGKVLVEEPRGTGLEHKEAPISVTTHRLREMPDEVPDAPASGARNYPPIGMSQPLVPRRRSIPGIAEKELICALAG